MSHYYHVYPGVVDGVGRGATSPGNRRNTPDPGQRSSTPISSSFNTPPPPGVSPGPKTTPEGVFTQVQRKKNVYVPEDDYSDGLFDDSFEFDEAMESQSQSQSNLTHIFPGCAVGEKEKQSDVQNEQPIPSKSPDLLSRVLARATTLDEDRRICEFDFCSNPDDPDNSSSGQHQGKDNAGRSKQHVSKILEKSASSPQLNAAGGVRQPSLPRHDLHAGTQLQADPHEYRTGSSSTSKRSAAESPGRDAGNMEVGGDEVQGHARSVDPSVAKPSHLSSEEIQRLLQGLVPDATVSRSESEISQQSSLPTKIPALSRLSSGTSYDQVSLDGSDSEIPVKLVPTAKSSRPISSKEFGPSKDAQEIATAVRYARHSVVRMIDGAVQDTGLEKHDFPAFSRKMMKAPDVEEIESGFGGEVEITIPELISTVRDQINVSFTSGPVAKFLLVARNSGTSRWSVPSTQRFHDVLNQAEGRIRREKLQCSGVLAWSSQWGGGIGLMGLRVTNPRALHIFRRTLSEVRIGGMWYNSYPKDFLNHDSEVSVYLRSNLRCFDIEFLPHSLYEKNRLLDGEIMVRYSKHHDYVDTPKPDNSFFQEGGKIIILQVDDQFLQSLQKYPPNYSFRLGSSTVKIKPEVDGPDISLNSSISTSTTIDASSSSLFGGMDPSEVRSISRKSRTRWEASGSGFQLPLPVPTVTKLEKFYSGGKTRSRGRRGGAGYIHKRVWK